MANNPIINNTRQSAMKRRRPWIKDVIINNKELLLIISLFILAIAVTWAITASVYKRPVMVQKGSEYYIVKNYDTLWGICDDYVPKGMDIRTYIDIVKRFNDIENDKWIYPGQMIEIPIFVDIYKK